MERLFYLLTHFLSIRVWIQGKYFPPLILKYLIAFGEAKKKRIIMGLKRRKLEGGLGLEGGRVAHKKPFSHSGVIPHIHPNLSIRRRFLMFLSELCDIMLVGRKIKQ
jgi:hypothetical protein